MLLFVYVEMIERLYLATLVTFSCAFVHVAYLLTLRR